MNTQSRDPNLNTVGQLAALCVVLFPVVGYFGTLFSLFLNSRLRNYDVLSLALDHSVPWLALNGAIAFFISGVLISAAVIEPRRWKEAAKRHAERPRWKKLLMLSPMICFLLLVVLFVNVMITAIVLALTAFPSWLLVRRNRTGPFTFRRMLAPVLITAVASTFVVATFGENLDTGSIRFSTNADVRDGYYSIVGSDGNQVYLLPCTGGAHLISVNNESLLSIRYEVRTESQFASGLIQGIRSGIWQKLGAQTHCPRSSS
jgi:hypothetical protein